MVIPYPQAPTHPPQVTLCSPAPQVITAHAATKHLPLHDGCTRFVAGLQLQLGGTLDTPKGNVGPINYGAQSICSRAQYVICKKYFSHPSLVIYVYATPKIKLKVGHQIGGGLLIANHLEQSYD